MRKFITLLAGLMIAIAGLAQPAGRPAELASENQQLAALTVDVPVAGQLMEVLGDNLETVEALTVTGEINADDFATMWNACFYGQLVDLDLSDAHVEGEVIPSQAMFRLNEEINSMDHLVYHIGLRKLILPKTVTEIGDMAFAYLTELTELGLPEALVKINESAFQECSKLTTEDFTFPEGLEYIGKYAFYNCSAMWGEIVFPESLRSVMRSAFSGCNLHRVIFPDGLEYIGALAFAGNCLNVVTVPDNCSLDPLGGQFYDNPWMVKAHLPENAEVIPADIFCGCLSLKEVNIPAATTTICENAFRDCKSLTEVVFPEGLFAIFENAFKYCQFKEINLPSTLFELEAGAFECCTSVEKITCKALIPPVNNGRNCDIRIGSPFGDDENFAYGIRRDIPVYIPVGTKELYEQSPSWNYFTNFIESDFTTGIDQLPSAPPTFEEAPSLYNLNGNQIANPTPGQIYIQAGKKHLHR